MYVENLISEKLKAKNLFFSSELTKRFAELALIRKVLELKMWLSSSSAIKKLKLLNEMDD